ncbi:nitrate reductase subunit beta [candidate division KSB1 bacterium]|nr:nitrate reductase subunit beta [candidate division KSB1 bacterium]
MDVRLQIAMVFHLDKCIGCHTCSIACKNIWTDREGTEYMWWNNVETKPGTGYPTLWEDQKKYKGGWDQNKNSKNNGKKDGKANGLKLKSTNKAKGMFNIFYQPNLPTIDDYYEPFSYKYEDLFDAPEGADQPTARPISLITGKPMDIEGGPNWDDDLGGSPVYAENDLNFSSLTPEEKKQMFELERLVFFYIPRICNHCLNPSCVASCPSGALYKRGEDGIVLVNQKTCRGWRYCVSACPYKKVYYNWKTGKSEKCILCFPRIETEQAPACFHSCVGRIRYLGGLLYDADKIHDAAQVDDSELVDVQREMILDPFDGKVIDNAHRNGIDDNVIKAAQNSPVYKYVKKWELALPLHPEFRTLPMLFYVPPMLPIMGALNDNIYNTAEDDFFTPIEKARVPVKFMASLFSAGNEGKVRKTLKKQLAVRAYRRFITVGDYDEDKVKQLLHEADSSAEEAEEIYRLTSLPSETDRYVIPHSHREEAIEMLESDTWVAKGNTGFGFKEKPVRGE